MKSLQVFCSKDRNGGEWRKLGLPLHSSMLHHFNCSLLSLYCQLQADLASTLAYICESRSLHFKSMWKICVTCASQLGNSRKKNHSTSFEKKIVMSDFFDGNEGCMKWWTLKSFLFFFLEHSVFKLILSLRTHSKMLTNGRTKQKHFTCRTLIRQELKKVNKLKLWQTSSSPPKKYPKQMTKVSKLSHFPNKNA